MHYSHLVRGEIIFPPNVSIINFRPTWNSEPGNNHPSARCVRVHSRSRAWQNIRVSRSIIIIPSKSHNGLMCIMSINCQLSWQLHELMICILSQFFYWFLSRQSIFNIVLLDTPSIFWKEIILFAELYNCNYIFSYAPIFYKFLHVSLQITSISSYSERVALDKK